MKTRDELSPAAHRRMLEQHRGSAAAAFAALASDCVRQFLVHNAIEPLPDSLLSAYVSRLWLVVQDVGLPPPLPDDEPGEPAERPPQLVADLASRVFAGLPFPERHDDLETPTRQLLKACLQPEFRRCRDSYKEVVEGVCRRQEPSRACQRISGSHCVDCPYWIALRPDQHRALLWKAWVTDPALGLEQEPELFLPEKYRALRLFLWRQARHDN